MDNEQQQDEVSQTRCFAYFMSHQFLFLFFILLNILFFVYIWNPTTHSGPFTSLVLDSPLNDSANPEYIIQLTDLHYHHLNPERTEHNYQLMKNISDKFNPVLVALTGDLVDASNSTETITFRKQYFGNWFDFNRTVIESGMVTPGRLVIPLAGNHDLMAVPIDDMNYNMFRKYALNDTDPFDIRSYTMNTDFKKLKVVVLNPLQPPMASAPVGMMPYVDRVLLDKLEDSIDSSATNIYLAHFPYYSTWSGKSKRGRDIESVITDFDVVLTGHYHPQTQQLHRHSNAITVVSTPSMRSSRFSLTSIDHGMTIVHDIDASDEVPVIITYPIPYNQITSRVDFSKTSFPVRSLLFSNSIQNLSCQIDGETVYQMEYLRTIRTNVHLYSYNVSGIAQGTHSLTILGGSKNVSVTFFVGSTTPNMTEPISGQSSLSITLLLILVLSQYFYAAIRVAPWWEIPGAKAFLDEFTKYIYGQKTELSVQWYQLFYYGPFYLICRLYKAPTKVYIVVLILSTWFFALPFYVTPVENLIGLVWIWGSVVDGKYKPHPMLLSVGMFYILFLQLPVVSLVGHLYERKKPGIITTVLLTLLIAFGLVAWYIFSFFAGENWGFFASPMTYVLIISLGLLIYWGINDRRTSVKSEPADDITSENNL